ncbi:MAG TPA: TonB-dependent receptor [Gammaproteobacteria bacterium]|nr:TonB-dependent receptor [Gammaproteobacteria bacterium]
MKSLLTRRGAFSALFLSIVLALVAPAVFAAQSGTDDQSDQGKEDQAQQLGTISVTGTRIRQVDVATSQPVLVLDREEIQHQGFTNVAAILQNLTAAGTPPISRQEVLAAGENVGGYYVDLRNLGASRTLVLLNGKRLGSTTYGLQDLSQIPIAAIERIEVLKAGASAIYGSDAIAGVINIITRNNFTGAQASAYYGKYTEGDGQKEIYSLTYGAQSDRGSIMIAAEYSTEDPVWASDRWFSKYPGTIRHPDAGWSPYSQYGNFFNGDPFADELVHYAPWCGGDLCTLNPGGNPFDLGDYHASYSGGPTADRSNTNMEQMLATGLSRKSVFVHADYGITDNIRVKTTFLYNHRETLQQVAGYPFNASFGIGLSPDSYFNPLGTGPRGNGAGETIYFRRRGWEVPRTTKSELTTYRIGSSLVGDFFIGPHIWTWEVGAYTNQNHALKVGHGDYSLPALEAAVGPSFLNESTGNVVCGTPDDPIPYGSAPGSCIPWNPIYPAGQVGQGSLTGHPDLQSFLFPYYHDTGVTRETDYSANISGSVVTLPAGDLAIAVGAEYRKESGKFVPDAFKQAALSTSLSSGPTGGSYDVTSYYAEVNIPLLRDVPGAQALALNVADRYSDYSSFGSTNNAKYSLSWRPIEELLIRGTYSEGFRAPQIHDLYGGTSGTFDYYTDPCDFSHAAGKNPEVAKRCTGGFGGQPGVPPGYVQLGQGNQPCTSFPCQTNLQFFSGSSPTLGPETSTTETAGFVYSPQWVPGRLDVSVDWYRIHIDNAITGDSVDDILYDCYVLGVASRCSSALFTRDPNLGVVTSAHYGERNAGWIETEGWDFGIHYQFPLTSFGLFALTWNTTYTDYYNQKADDKPDTPIDEYTGWGANFRVRSNASLNWSMGPFGVTWTLRYYSPIRDWPCSWDVSGGPECNEPKIMHNGKIVSANQLGSNTFHDVQFRYNTPWNATVALGVNNAFDHFSAPVYSAPNSTYPYYGGFDIGRFWYVRYTQDF